MPVIVLAGEEEFLISRRVDELKESLLDPQWAAFNFSKTQTPAISEISDLAVSLPFGSGNKVIVFDRCDLFTKKRSAKEGDSAAKASTDKAQALLLNDLEQALSVVSDQTYLIFACPYNFDSTLKISKVVEKHANIEKYTKERFFVGSRSPQLLTWCQKEAHRLKCTIEEDAAQYLIDSTEADLRQIAQDINKAAVYLLPKTHITKDVVANLSPNHAHVFTLLDQWLKNKHKDALTSVEELLSRQSGIPLIATIQSFMSKWIQVKALATAKLRDMPASSGRREVPPGDMAKRIAPELKAHPFAVEQDLKRLSGISLKALCAKKTQLTDLEYRAKTGQLSDREALFVFLSTRPQE